MNKIEDFLKYNGFKDVSEKVPIDFHEQFGSGFGIVYVLSKRWTRVKDDVFTEVKVGKASGCSEINIFATCYYNDTYSSFELHRPNYAILDEFTYYLNACEQRVKSLYKPKDELKLNTALDKAANGTLKDWLESQKDIETLLDKENEKMNKETKNMEHYWPCVHIEVKNDSKPGYTRLSYDLTSFNTEQLSELKEFAKEVNHRFTNASIHITPERWVKEEQTLTREIGNSEDEANAPTEYGKYVDECLNEASKHFFSEGEDKYSVADLFYAGVRCGKSWFENQEDKS